jgi:hypothetical protein
MPLVNSRQSLKEYGLRKLGSPVIQINVDDDQLEDRIDDAIAKWREHHSESLIRRYLTIPLTQPMIDAKSIPMPDVTYSVIKLFPLNAGMGSSFGQLGMYAAMSDLVQSVTKPNGTGGTPVTQYYIMEQNLSLLQQFFNAEKSVIFNQYQQRLQIDMDWTKLNVGDKIMVEVWAAYDMDDFDASWNDGWLKKYTTALFKLQWGNNLSKYDGFQLPSGIVLNGAKIHDEAVAEITELEQQLLDNYALPVSFFVG